MSSAIGSLLAQWFLDLIDVSTVKLDKVGKRLCRKPFVVLLALVILAFYQSDKPDHALFWTLGESEEHKILLDATRGFIETRQEGHLYMPIILLHEVPNAPDLRVLIWNWKGCDTCAADLTSNFDQALNAFRESSGKKVELTTVDTPFYNSKLNSSLREAPYTHLVWISQEMLPELVEEELIMPLDEFYTAHPEVAADLPEASLTRFYLNGHLYGIPLGPAEEWNWNAYAISRKSLAAVKAELAFELLRFLRARVPPHGLPELTIEELWAEPDNPNVGEPFLFSAAIGNVGEANAVNVKVAFYTPSGDLIAERVIESIDMGAVEFAGVETINTEPELVWYMAEIDPQGLIQEPNKENNSGYLPLGTGAGAPPTPVATSQPFCIDADAYQTTKPKVAFDGTNYLVAYVKQNNPLSKTTNGQLKGARVSPNGTVIDTNGFVISSTLGWYYSLDLAFDGTNYLVVWERENPATGGYGNVDPGTFIYGARVSKAGNVLDNPPFVIEQEATPPTNYYPSQLWHRWPKVIYTGSDYRVMYSTWTDCGGCPLVYTQDGVYARKVSKAGVVGAKQQLLQFNKNFYLLLGLAFKQAQAFLFMDSRLGKPVIQNITGSWISGFTASKLTATSPLKLALDGAVSTWPFGRGAVSAGNANQYLAVWEYKVNKKYPDLHFGIASGSVWSNKTALMKGISEMEPAIAFDGKNYLTVFSHSASCKRFLGAVHVNTFGVPGQPTYFNPSTTWAFAVYYPEVAFGSNNFLVVFENMHAPSAPGAGDWYMQACGQLVQKTP